MRGVDELVPAAFMLGAAVILSDLAQHPPPRVPEDQPRTDVLIDAEQVQLAPKLAVVALPGLFLLPQVLLELLGRLPGRAVDALQHRLLLIAAPVGAGDAQQLHAGGVDLPGALDVRPAAQVGEGAVAEDRDLRLLINHRPVLVLSPGFQSGDQLELVRLVGEHAAGVVARECLALKGMVLVDDLAHTRLERLQVLRGQRARELEVVVEAVVDRRTDGDARLAREHLHHGLGHHVRRRMADAVQLGALVVFLRHGHRVLLAHKHKAPTDWGGSSCSHGSTQIGPRAGTISDSR